MPVSAHLTDRYRSAPTRRLFCQKAKKVTTSHWSRILSVAMVLALPLPASHAATSFTAHDEPSSNQVREYPDDGLSYQWSQAQYHTFYADFNGDLITDMLLQPKIAGDEVVYIQGITIDGVTRYTNGKVVTFSSALGSALDSKSGDLDWSGQGLRLLAADYNGDGFADILAFTQPQRDGDSEKNGVYLSLGSPSGINLTNKTMLTTSTNNNPFPFVANLDYYTLHTGDANGDGAADVFAFTQEKKNAQRQKLAHFITLAGTVGDSADAGASDGDKAYFTTAREIDNKHEFRSKNIGAVFIEDFNHDQRSDIFIQGKKRNNPHSYFIADATGHYHFDQGVEFKADFGGQHWNEKHFRLLPADVNNDGFTDLIRLPKDTQDLNDNNQYAYLSPQMAVSDVTELSGATTPASVTGSTDNTDRTAVQIAAPQNISYGDTDDHGNLSVGWDDSGADVYLLEQQIGSEEWQSVYQGSINHYFKDKNSAGDFRFRVAACRQMRSNVLNCSAYTQGTNTLVVAEQNQSNQSPLVTSALAGIPAVPTGLTIIGSTSIKPYTNYQLTWHSPSGTGDGIYFTLIGEQSGVLENNITATTASPRNKAPGTYYYRVRACNTGVGCSGYSALSPAAVVYGTPGVPSYTVTPATAVANSNYTVSWGSASGVVHNYELVGELSDLIYTSPNGNTYNTSRNKPPGTYYYKTRACNDYKCNWQYSVTSAGITVTTANTAPQATADSASVNEDSDVIINVQSNDSDVDGDPLSTVIYSDPGHGLASLSGNNIRYTPNPNYYGSDSFSYYVVDSGGLSSQVVTVSLNVLNVVEGTLSVPVISPTGGTYQNSKTVTITAASGAGIYYSTNNGQSYSLYSGVLTLTNTTSIKAYATKTDWNNSPVSNAVTIGINHPPSIFGSPATSIAAGNPYNFTPGKSDPDGDALTFGIVNKPSWASFSTTTGTLSGTPNTIASHSNIVISVSDGDVSASLPTFTIVVTIPARKIYFIHSDLLGTPVAETDENGGIQ